MSSEGELVGASIAHFRILEKLGQGGMGVVYKASDEKLRRTVALKVLPEGFASDEDRRRRFLREARSAAAVSHANIATVHEIGEFDGRIYIAMELIEGRSLRALLTEKALPIKDSVRIAKDVLRGVAKAHEKGVIHRDLKPDNVMVTDDFEVKVLDFGVAKLTMAQETTLDVLVAPETNPPATADTGIGRLVGTPAYMSPEQATGRPVDHRTDIFSFGVMLYEMVTGTRPFASSSVVAVLVATTCDTPEPPSKRNPLVLPSLERIISRCLAKRAEDRYDTARELLRDLENLDAPDLAASVPTLASSPAALAAIAVESAKSLPAASSTFGSAEPPKPKRGKAPVAVAGAVAVALGVFGIVRLMAEKAPTTPAEPTTSAAPSAPAKPTALTDLPPPKSQSAEALAAYQLGVAAFHDGNFEAFDAAMRDAVRFDPSFAAGEMRLAFSKWHSVRGAVTDARNHLQRAARLRAQLSPRDQMFLDVLEPVIGREPPDSEELERRLHAALEKYPLDAEFLYLLANEQRRYDVDASLATYERVLEADPGFMTGLRQKAQTQEMRGDVDGARASLDLCLQKVPGATGCRNERIWLNQNEGKCDAIEDDARQMIAADPESYRGYEALARAGIAIGRPRSAIDEIWKQTWKRAPPEVRARDEIRTSAELAVLDGRFDDAKELARKYDAAIEADTAASVHAGAALLLVETAFETGDVAGAGKAAQAFLNRQTAWSGAPDAATARMLHVTKLAGLLDDARYRAARADFLDGWMRQSSRTRFAKGVAWVLAFGGEVETKDDADEALRELPARAPVPVGLRTSANDEALGRTSFFAGKIDDAIRPLTRAARMCVASIDPVRHVRVHLILGEALEAKGDTKGACDAYAVVTRHWGDAKPRSVTADKAKERAKKLGCAR